MPRVHKSDDPRAPPFVFVEAPKRKLDSSLMYYYVGEDDEGDSIYKQHPIEHVLARLEHDEAYEHWRDRRVIGYLDRFMGIVELDWAQWQLAEIPLHRVRYVRNDWTAEIVWVREGPKQTEQQLKDQKKAREEAYDHYYHEMVLPLCH